MSDPLCKTGGVEDRERACAKPRKSAHNIDLQFMTPTPEQMTAVKTALCSMLETPTSEFELPSQAEYRSAALDEALERFFSSNHEASNLQEFVELVCRHLS